MQWTDPLQFNRMGKSTVFTCNILLFIYLFIYLFIIYSSYLFVLFHLFDLSIYFYLLIIITVVIIYAFVPAYVIR